VPSVAFSIDSRGAEQGAARYSAAIDRVIRDAQRAVQAIDAVDRAMRASGAASSASAAGMSRFFSAVNQVNRVTRPAAQNVGGFAVAMRDLGSASVLAFGPLSGVGARFTAIGALATRSNLALGATIGVVTGVGVALTKAVKEAAAFEESMLRVAKVTDASARELLVMSDDLLKMSSSLGVSTKELAQIEERAAQMGIRGSANLAAFTEQVAILTRTTNLGAAEAATQLGRFIQLTRSTAQDAKGIAAALVDVGNKFNATEAEILSITEELSRAGTAFNVGGNQLLALGAALASVGEHGERSATAVSQALVRITQAASGGGEQLQRFAKAVGVSTEEFQRLAKADIGSLFFKLLGTLRDAGPQAAQLLKDLNVGSERNIKVFLSLAQSLDRLNLALGAVNTQIKNPTAAMVEFERLSQGLNRQLEIAGTQIANLAAVFGATLLPPLTEAVKTVNAFLAAMQGVEPVGVEVSESMQRFANGVVIASRAVDVLRIGLAETFLVAGRLATMGPLGAAGGFEQTQRAIEKLNIDLARLRAGEKLPLFGSAAADARKLQAAVEGVTGTIAEASHAPRTVAEAMGALDKANRRTAESFDKNKDAIEKALGALDRDIAAKRALATQGEAAAKAQEIINKLTEDGITVDGPARAAILAKAQALVGYADQAKAGEKATKDLAKAMEQFEEGLEGVLRDLDQQLRVEGLDEGQKAVVELTQKIEELRDKAVKGGLDEATARRLANAALAEAIPLQQQLNDQQQDKARTDILRDLDREIELRRLANTEGEAAAETQRQLNDLFDRGIPVSDEYADSLRAKNEALAEFGETSTVVADAFEDFISGIARGTQELSLDGIADAFKAAFAASVKEKLEFDKIFKGNLFELADDVSSLLGGSFSDVFSGAASGFKGLFSGQGFGGFSFGGAGAASAAITGLDTTRLLALGFSPEEVARLQAGFATPTGVNAGGWGGIISSSGASLGFLGSQLTNPFVFRRGATGLSGGAQFVEGDILGRGENINTVITTALGAFLGPLGAIIGTAISALGGMVAMSGIDRTALRNQHFSGLAGGIQESERWFFNPGGFGFTPADLIFELLGIPTLGTAFRRYGESIIDSSKVFGGEDGKGGLQGLLGDWTRTAHKTGIETARSRGFSDEQIDLIRGGTEGLFGFLLKDEKHSEDMGRLALEQGRTMAEFLSRGLAEGMEFEELFSSLRAFAQEAGITLEQAIGNLPKVMEGVTKQAQEFGGVDATSAAREGAEAYARELLGIAEIYSADVPAGVSIAEVALQTLERDGVKAFGELTDTTKDWLKLLADSPVEFQKQVAALAGQGFTVDVEEFKATLADVTASATFIGENFAQIFSSPNMIDGINTMAQTLKEHVVGAVQGAGLEKLFDTTRIAESFQGVFSLLRQLGEGTLDVTTAEGSASFAEQMAAAILEGKENLQQYIPQLRAIRDASREAGEIIEEAFKPTEEEERWLWLEEQLKANTDAAKGFAASLFEVAAAAEAGRPGSGQAAARAAAQAQIDASLRQSAINLVGEAAMESVQGEAFARAQTEWEAAFKHAMVDGVISAEEELQLETLRRKLEEAGKGLADSMAEAAAVMGRMFSVQLERAKETAQSIFGGSLSAFFDKIKSGGSVREAKIEFGESFKTGLRDAIIGSMQEAMVNTIMTQSVMAPLMATFQTEFAKAIEDGRIDAAEQDRLDAIMRLVFERGEQLVTLLDGTITRAGEIAKNAYDYSRRVDRDVRVENGDIVRGDSRRGVAGTPYSIAEVQQFTRLLGLTEERDRQMILLLLDQGKTFSQIWDDLSKLAPFDKAGAGGVKTLGEESKDASTSVDRLASASDSVTEAFNRLIAVMGSFTLPGAALGGTFGAGGLGVVGERGPELLVAHADGGATIIPLPRGAASALLGHGMPGFAAGGSMPPAVSKDYVNLVGRREQTDGEKEEPAFLGAIRSAFEAALKNGKDFADEFAKNLQESTSAALADALVEGFNKRKDIDRASQNIDTLLEAAGALVTRGQATPEKLAEIQAQIAAQTAYITEQARAIEPLLRQAMAAQKIGDAVGSSLSGVEGVLNDFALDPSDLTGMREALNNTTEQAILDGVIAGLLASGPIADALDDFKNGLQDKITEAMADGTMSPEEASAIGEWARAARDALGERFEELAPIFEALGINIGDGLSAAAKQFSGSFASAIDRVLEKEGGASFEDFSLAIRETLYQHIKGALIDAFIDQALINGALAPMLTAIAGIFAKVMTMSVGEAVEAIGEQIALILDVLDDPAFKAAWAEFMAGMAKVRTSLGLTSVAVEKSADRLTEAAEAAEKAECTQCELEQRLARIQLGQQALDVFGRGGRGYLDVLVPTMPPKPDVAGGDGFTADDIMRRSSLLRGLSERVAGSAIGEILSDHPGMSEQSLSGIRRGMAQFFVTEAERLAALDKAAIAADFMRTWVGGKWYSGSITRDEVASWLPGLAEGGYVAREGIFRLAEGNRGEYVTPDSDVRDALAEGRAGNEAIERRLARLERLAERQTSALERIARVAESGDGNGGGARAVLHGMVEQARWGTRTRARIGARDQIRG